jgi:hypothetical protein
VSHEMGGRAESWLAQPVQQSFAHARIGRLKLTRLELV